MTRYGVIVADPPWSYSNSGTRGAAENEYSTMPLDAICALPVRDRAADNAVLFLWGTWPLLPECIHVMDAWGFQYKTGFPWIKILDEPRMSLFGDMIIKPQYGVGFWVRGASEYVTIGTRGKVSPPNSGFVGLLSENFQHSRKPDNIYEIAESLPGPYLELFARRQRDGWDAFGNEVKNSVALAGDL